ncbi:hypothetical protein IP88_11240 [alpha proteobacterium AAP81b]|nr:hypothetical protein IP88_11240 [alpha proteobacterium AAP81b]
MSADLPFDGAPPPEAGLAMTLAVVAAAATPLLLLDGECSIFAASQSFRDAFGLAPVPAPLGSIFDLGGGEWNLLRLRSLLEATLAGDESIPAYERDLALPGRGRRRLVLNARKLVYPGDGGRQQLLLAVADVTDLRLADEAHERLLREKVLLLKEIQHRIANSLQIVASVLMQSARRVSNDESRVHLCDAHSRVMAIAELQTHLSGAPEGQVDVRSYLDKLCQSVSASMIDDHKRLTIVVIADSGSVSADVSVSLGLVVTELVINALKHAFAPDMRGRITVNYRSNGDEWRLEVWDDGRGMPKVAAAPGLGTSIVTALARHLKADVTVSDAKPGTSVVMRHRGSGDAKPALAEAAL